MHIFSKICNRCLPLQIFCMDFSAFLCYDMGSTKNMQKACLCNKRRYNEPQKCASTREIFPFDFTY